MFLSKYFAAWTKFFIWESTASLLGMFSIETSSSKDR